MITCFSIEIGKMMFTYDVQRSDRWPGSSYLPLSYDRGNWGERDCFPNTRSPMSPRQEDDMFLQRSCWGLSIYQNRRCRVSKRSADLEASFEWKSWHILYRVSSLWWLSPLSVWGVIETPQASARMAMGEWLSLPEKGGSKSPISSPSHIDTFKNHDS